jgi:hypothetical protein
MGAERAGALEFFVAARDDRDLCSGHARELQREQRDAARALHQHVLSGAQIAFGKQRRPGSERRAGQCCRFSKIERCRLVYERGCGQADVLCKHTVVLAAERCGMVGGGGRACLPVGVEAAHHGITRCESVHAFAHGFHRTRAVGERNHARLVRVEACEDAEVPVVDRCGSQTDQHLACARLRRLLFHATQACGAGLVQSEGFHARAPQRSWLKLAALRADSS